MSAHLERAQLLLQQSRPADAEQEALLALSQRPDQPLAHAYLALSRSAQSKFDEALDSARTAVGLAPDSGFFRYVLALVLHRSDREDHAVLEVAEAIRLNPDDENNFALLASIELARRNWPAALEAAERGLALSPEDVGCANLRSMALVRLGRKTEAMEAVDFALEREPDNALSHANQGWNCLHKNDPKRAQNHFREALRLNPELEYARHGMLEALKARNPVYRGMLAYFLWMARQSGRLQAVFVIGTFLGLRWVRSLAETHETWGRFLWPIVIAFYVFIYLSWTAVPMFNLLLRVDRFGRYVLSAVERTATNFFGTCIATGLAGLGVWAVTGREMGALLALISVALSICVAITFGRPARTRRWFGIASIGLGLVGVATLVLAMTNEEVGYSIGLLFGLGFFAIQIAANVVRR